VDRDFSFLQDVLDAVVATTAADFGIVYVCAEREPKLHIAAQSGLLPSLAEAVSAPFLEGESNPIAQVMRLRRRLFIEDIESDEAYAPQRDLARRVGYRALSATPLVSHRGRVIGILVILFKRPMRASAFAYEALGLNARIAADVIEAGRLKGEITRRIGSVPRKISDVELKTAIRRLATNADDSRLVERILALGDRYVSEMIVQVEALQDRRANPR
jgi:GAF domain-containing protein